MYGRFALIVWLHLSSHLFLSSAWRLNLNLFYLFKSVRLTLAVSSNLLRSFSGAGGVPGVLGLIVKVFLATARVGICGTPAPGGLSGATFVTHLRGEPANAVLIQKMTKRTHGNL